MPPATETHVVTGAFGYSGKYITERLLKMGLTVGTLTGSPNRPSPFGDRVKAFPYHFDNPAKLAESLKGARVLYNTYWVRFNHRDFNHTLAVENTLRLFEAAQQAGVERIVHVSITNPSADSPLSYFRGKARLEEALRQSGRSHAILRPAVLFGHEDILINNIAWILRHFPLFGVFGDGNYSLQPIHVDDFAQLAASQGQGHENTTIDAIGPETFTYRELVRAIGQAIGCQRPIVPIPDTLGYFVGYLLGKVVGDVTITREEIEGLKQNLLLTRSPAAGPTRLSDWAQAHAARLGTRYASELARRQNRAQAYARL